MLVTEKRTVSRSGVRNTGFRGEFEQNFIPTPKGRTMYLHCLFGPCICCVPTVEILWKDRASWRFVYLWDKLWKELPQEIYRMIDKNLVKDVYECSVCKTKKDYPFECNGE